MAEDLCFRKFCTSLVQFSALTIEVLADAGRCSKSFWDWDFLEDRLKGANPKTGQKSVVLGLTGHTAHSERGQSQNDLGQRDPVKDLLYNLRENS